MNDSDAERRYTDTPTTIVAQDRLSIYAGATTYLLGAGLWSESGNLELDTGELVFDNFTDTDQSTSFGINGSISFVGGFDPANSDLGGTFAYRDIEALTFATVGPGTIRVRDLEGFDFSGLNRDPDNMQRVISQTDFSIEIPGINLTRWTQQVRDTINLLEAGTASVPERIKAEGKQAVDLYRDAILGGYSREQLAEFTLSGEFAKFLNRRKSYEAARVAGEKTPAELARIAYLIGQDEKLFFDEFDGVLKVQTSCETSGTICGVPVSELENLTEAQVSAFIAESLAELSGRSAAEPAYLSAANLALQCAMYWHIANKGDGGNSGQYLRQIVAAVPDDPYTARGLGLQPSALQLFKIAIGQSDYSRQEWLAAWTPWIDDVANYAAYPELHDWAKAVKAVFESDGGASDYELGLILYTGSETDRRLTQIASTAVDTASLIASLGAGFRSIYRLGKSVKSPYAQGIRSPVASPTTKQLAVAENYGVDPRWVKADGKIDWPPNNGFDGVPSIVELQPGAKIDRYGGRLQDGELRDTGSYASPLGVPFEQRSLTTDSLSKPYQQYEVLRAIPNVQSGKTAAWFDRTGGGMQYKLPNSIDDLVRSGYLRRVTE